jgi:hypothetical protein
MVIRLLWGEAAGPWRWPTAPSTAEVKERVQLYIYTFLTYSRVDFTFTFIRLAITHICKTLFWRNLSFISY